MLTLLLTATLSAASSAALPPAATPQEGATWPQWRGPQRDGQIGGAPWPEDLEPGTLDLAWSAEDLGESYATPVVGPKHVYTVGSAGGRELVRAFDRETGEQAWIAAWEGEMTVPFFAAENGSWVRSSPAFDGESLFVAGMRDVLVCLDAATGDVRWKVDFVESMGTPLPSFGFVCSPLVVGDHVYVQAGASFAKLDKRTGEVVWRSLQDGGGMDSQFSSPILATLGGVEQLVVLTRTTLVGVSPADGSVLWSRPVEAFRGMNILTPLPLGSDAVFTAPYGGKAQRLDLSGLGQEGSDVAIEQAWTARSQGYMCSPVLVDGYVYYFARSNRFVCVDAETGEDAWVSGPTGDDYWSLIAQDNRILALSDTGILRMLEATPEEYRVLSEREVGTDSSTWAHVVAVDGLVVVRGLEWLRAFRWAAPEKEM